MTNKQLIEAYITYNENGEGKPLGKNGKRSLSYDGSNFYSYSTKMAHYTEGGCILNPRIYSATTSKQMSMLRRCLISEGVPFSYLIERE